MKTRDQLRAERASALVAAIKSDQVVPYTSELTAFAASLHENGLGPALAFLRSKAEPAKTALYDHLSSWVSETIYGKAKADLLELVVANSAEQMMRAQDEALALVNWLRRFAEAREPKARKA